MRVSLAAEGAEYKTPFFGLAAAGDGFAAEVVHLGVVVGLAGEFSAVGVVPVGG